MSDSQSEIIQQLAVPRYAPRIRPIPIPGAAWNDAPLFCLQLNDEWVSHVLGALEVLDQSDTWQGTEDEIRAAREQVNQLMLAFMQMCEETVAEFRIDDCDLQWRENSDSDWISLGNVCGADGADGATGATGAAGATGSTGATGATGEPGEKGDKGDCCGVDDVTTPTTSDNATFCGMATYFVKWHNDEWTDIMQREQAAADVADAIAGAVDAIPGIGILLSPFTAVAHEVADLADATIDTYLAQVDTEFLEKVQCDLYCDLKAAGTYSAALVTSWAQGIEDDAGLLLGQRLWGRFAKLYTDAEITKRFSVGAEVPFDDCETLCEECADAEAIRIYAICNGTLGGTETDWDGEFLTVDATLAGGTYFIRLVTDAVASASCVPENVTGFFTFENSDDGVQILTGSAIFATVMLGADYTETVPSGLPHEICSHRFTWTSDGPFSMKFKAIAC